MTGSRSTISRDGGPRADEISPAIESRLFVQRRTRSRSDTRSHQGRYDAGNMDMARLDDHTDALQRSAGDGGACDVEAGNIAFHGLRIVPRLTIGSLHVGSQHV